MLAAAFVFVTVRTEKDILLVNQMSLKHMRGTWSTLVLPPRPWGSSVCSAEYRVQFLVEVLHAHRQSGKYRINNRDPFSEPCTTFAVQLSRTSIFRSGSIQRSMMLMPHIAWLLWRSRPSNTMSCHFS